MYGPREIGTQSDCVRGLLTVDDFDIVARWTQDE